MARFLKSDPTLAALLGSIRACRICRDAPLSVALTHEPRPIVRVTPTARLVIAGQAPGVRVHASGLPFDDASGDRLRDWMGISREVFYDASRIATVPMGFCFPGHDSQKGDLPPRRECRLAWHDRLFALLPQVETILAIGRHGQAYHFTRLQRAFPASASMGDIVRASLQAPQRQPRIIALPHPSWRNSGWLKNNPWFEQEILPVLRQEVARLVG